MLGSSFLFGKEPEGCRQIAIGAHGSAARADCLPRGKPTVSDGKSQLCRRGAPARGLTRRLRRERWGCRPQGDRTFFRSERKYQRKPAAQLAWGILCSCRGDVTVRPDFFATPKASVKSNPRWPFEASHEAHRRMAVWARQQTGSRARPASREALRRAAVKPRPSSMSPYAPARTARSPGSRGSAPCASHEARRRMAVWARQQTGSRARPASRGTCRATVVKPQPTCMSLSAPARPWRAVRG